MRDTVMLGLGSAALGGAVAVATPVALAALDRANRATADRLRADLDAAGMDAAALPTYLRAWRVATVGVGLVVWLGLDMLPVALFLVFLVHKLGPLGMAYRIAAHRRRTAEQVVSAARGLAGRVRAGVPLEEALADVAADLPDPFGAHLRGVTRQLGQGADIREALADLKDRVRIDAVAVLVIALQVAVERGGRLADVLDRITGSLDELARVTRKRETDTAAGRLMVFLMSVFPAAFLGFFFVLDPDMTRLVFDLFAGQVVLAVVGAIVYVSVRWAGRILDRVE